jgi:hypothetical protein
MTFAVCVFISYLYTLSLPARLNNGIMAEALYQTIERQANKNETLNNEKD